MTDGVLPSLPLPSCFPAFLPKKLKFHIASPTTISLYMYFAQELTKETTVISGLSTPTLPIALNSSVTTLVPAAATALPAGTSPCLMVP